MINRKGFTLIELIVVIAIIGILTSIIYPNLVTYRERAREKERQAQEYVVNKALRQYYAFTGSYPGAPQNEDEMKALLEGLKQETGIITNTDKFNYVYVVSGDGACSINVTYK